MQEYKTFIFERYSFDPNTGVIELHYSLDDEVAFIETLRLPVKDFRVDMTDPELLDRALFQLHMIGGISYFKTCCPPNIEIRSGALSASQAQFWKTVYEHGLGQFFYENNLDFRDRISFPVGRDSEPKPVSWTPVRKEVLVPVGGGKDSAVTIELLRESGIPLDLLRVGAHPLIEKFATIAGADLVTVDRSLPAALFTLNAEGAWNGHIPITAYHSFLSLILSLVYGYRAVVFSNERSADVGSVLYYGMDINHQWSKGLEFERMFHALVRNTLSPDLSVFSLLRPLSELHIAKVFAKYPQYFDIATSCNKNWKLLEKERVQQRWCGKCPKCAFVFALLAAFLSKEEVLKIFGSDFFENPELTAYYRQLLGMEGFKPFECVGTPDETKAAFLLIRERGEFNDTPIMRLFAEQELPLIADPDALIAASLLPSTEHDIPSDFSTVLSSLT